MINVIKRLWYGDYSLAKTYWGWGLLGGIALGFLLTIPAVVVGSITLIYLVELIRLAFSVIMLVAIWRSARKYTGSRIWRFLAQLGAVGAVLVFSYAVAIMFLLDTNEWLKTSGYGIWIELMSGGN